MSKEAIINRIVSDAEAERAAQISDAKARAEAIVAEANARAEERKAETEAEISERISRIREGKAAAARLESAKILLAEKRRVMDEIYVRAMQGLLSLDERSSLNLMSRLLEEYAEEGDEIVFAENFAFAAKAAMLPIVEARNLKVSQDRMKLQGGCFLRGKVCDKDLSFGALLALDREERQSEIAEKLFRA